MLDVCLFGAGRIAAVHAANIAAHPKLALRHVVDPNTDAATALAAAHGAEAGSDPRLALADPEVDAVLIASSSASHAGLIHRAVGARKPVLCEKPLDLDVASAAQLVRVAAAAAVPVMVDFNRRFDNHHAAVHQSVQTGEVGSVELIKITSRDPEPPPLDYLEHSPGALFLETMVHDMDMARWLLGEEPVEVHAMASCLINPAFQELDEADTAIAMLRTTSGRLAQIDNSWRATYGYDQRVEVLGSGGMVRSGNLHQTTVERFDARAVRRDVLEHFYVERYAQSYRRALDHFADVVEHGVQPLVTAEDGRRALILAAAARRAATTGRPQAIAY